VALSVLVARPVLAAEFSSRDDNWEAGYDPGKQKRRSDFTMGLALGAGVGDASRYPHEVAQIRDSEYEANTRVAGGTSLSIWLGVAFRDWLVFGFGPRLSTIQSSGCPLFVSKGSTPANCTAAFSGGFTMHLEAYPLFYQGGHFQDLGVFTEMGAVQR